MRTNFDFSPFRRSTVGFDQLFEMLERGAAAPANEGYPPFDIEQLGEDRYRITLAIAGFRRDEIDITAQQNQLIVTGQRVDDGGERRLIHRGIATRTFERRFALGDFVKVRSADLSDGLLTIALEREIPEEMKPHKISIGERGDSRIGVSEGTSVSAENENGEAAQVA